MKSARQGTPSSQYRIAAEDMPIECHLGTIDVLEDGGSSLVVYSTDVVPGEVADQMDGVQAEARFES